MLSSPGINAIDAKSSPHNGLSRRYDAKSFAASSFGMNGVICIVSLTNESSGMTRRCVCYCNTIAMGACGISLDINVNVLLLTLASKCGQNQQKGSERRIKKCMKFTRLF